jgi:hypothetical protein
MNYHVECNDGKVHYSRCSADVSWVCMDHFLGEKYDHKTFIKLTIGYLTKHWVVMQPI